MPALALLLAGCTKWLDVNNNPNQPTSAPLNGLLGSITQNTALNMFRAAYPVSYYVQYQASPNPASPTDVYDVTDQSSLWNNLYYTMTDAFELQRQAAENNAPHMQGIAKILTAINLKIVHDLWGDAPYSESFDLISLTPGYDDAESLYSQVLTLLDEGIALMGQTENAVAIDGTLDFIHGGDAAAWIKTANGIKARTLNLVSNTSQYNAASVLAAVDASYTSNADDAEVTDFNIRNPWSQVAVNNANLVLDGWLSTNIINALNGTTYGVMDPRISLITDTTKFGDYRGTRNGIGRPGSGVGRDESYITTNGFYSSTNSPLVIMSYSELKMIEAEAAFRSGNTARAYAAYLEAIRAHMDKMGVPSAAAQAYINSPQVSVGAGNLTLKRIFEEKYKITLLQYEAYNDARRFDFAYTGFQLPANALLDEPPRRLDYPSVEVSRNGANVPEITGLLDRLWWDQ